LARRRTWTTVDLPPSMASRGAGKTAVVVQAEGEGGLPRRFHFTRARAKARMEAEIHI
jgi:hypothetical protein